MRIILLAGIAVRYH